MKNDTTSHTSQDYDRKHGCDHIASNSRAAKDLPDSKDSETAEENPAIAEIISKGHTIATNPAVKSSFTEDKRETARHEHTNHFTKRTSSENK